MSCCKKEVNLVQVEDLKASALGFGFDANWIADIVEKYGHDVLSLVVEAMRSGFSLAFVVEVVNKFGPVLLEFLLTLLNKKKMHALAAGEEFVVGDEVGVLDWALIETLIKKYLPIIVEKYGDAIVKFIVDWITNTFLKK